MPKRRPKPTGSIVTAQGPWRELLIVCRKCLRKREQGGFGPAGRDRLIDALKSELRSAGLRREVRLITSSCLGICPKGGVTVLRGDRPGEMLVVPEGADPADLRACLGIRPSSPAEPKPS